MFMAQLDKMHKQSAETLETKRSSLNTEVGTNQFSELEKRMDAMSLQMQKIKLSIQKLQEKEKPSSEFSVAALKIQKPEFDIQVSFPQLQHPRQRLPIRSIILKYKLKNSPEELEIFQNQEQIGISTIINIQGKSRVFQGMINQEMLNQKKFRKEQDILAFQEKYFQTVSTVIKGFHQGIWNVRLVRVNEEYALNFEYCIQSEYYFFFYVPLHERKKNFEEQVIDILHQDLAQICKRSQDHQEKLIEQIKKKNEFLQQQILRKHGEGLQKIENKESELKRYLINLIITQKQETESELKILKSQQLQTNKRLSQIDEIRQKLSQVKEEVNSKLNLMLRSSRQSNSELNQSLLNFQREKVELINYVRQDLEGILLKKITFDVTTPYSNSFSFKKKLIKFQSSMERYTQLLGQKHLPDECSSFFGFKIIESQSLKIKVGIVDRTEEKFARAAEKKYYLLDVQNRSVEDGPKAIKKALNNVTFKKGDLIQIQVKLTLNSKKQNFIRWSVNQDTLATLEFPSDNSYWLMCVQLFDQGDVVQYFQGRCQ